MVIVWAERWRPLEEEEEEAMGIAWAEGRRPLEASAVIIRIIIRSDLA